MPPWKLCRLTAPRLGALRIVAFVVCGLVWCGSAQAEAPVPKEVLSGDVAGLIGANPGTPPAGFESPDEMMSALQQGQIPVIQAPAETSDVEVRNAVVYATHGNQKVLLDLYLPKNEETQRPGIVLIHGGAWTGGSKNDYEVYGLHFAQQGYVAISINYRMLPRHPFPACLQDCKAAVRWLRANAEEFHLDSNRIAAMGGSAGGHLALLVGYTDEPELEGDGGNAEFSSQVQAVVDLYGPTDLAQPKFQTDPYVSNLLQTLIGGTLDERKNDYVLASPLFQATKDSPPTLILHGTIDNVVNVNQSDVLAAKLAELNVPYVYDRVPGWPHAMDIAQSINDRTLFLADRFLKHTLRAEAKSP